MSLKTPKTCAYQGSTWNAVTVLLRNTADLFRFICLYHRYVRWQDEQEGEVTSDGCRPNNLFLIKTEFLQTENLYSESLIAQILI